MNEAVTAVAAAVVLLAGVLTVRGGCTTSGGAWAPPTTAPPTRRCTQLRSPRLPCAAARTRRAPPLASPHPHPPRHTHGRDHRHVRGRWRGARPGDPHGDVAALTSAALESGTTQASGQAIVAPLSVDGVVVGIRPIGNRVCRPVTTIALKPYRRAPAVANQEAVATTSGP